MYKLHKHSSPGWTKEFPTEYDCRQELLKHICNLCLEGKEVYYDYVGCDDELDWVEHFDVERIPNKYNIESLLGTSCGCEYGFEEA